MGSKWVCNHLKTRLQYKIKLKIKKNKAWPDQEGKSGTITGYGPKIQMRTFSRMEDPGTPTPYRKGGGKG